MASNNIVWGPGSAARPSGSAFEVIPAQPLETLRSPHAAAFGCLCADRPSESFFALISDPALPPRFELIEKLAGLELNNVMTPVGWGPVDLPGLPPSSWATVFERPSGVRLVTALTETITPMSADEVLRKILPPLVVTLRVFADLRLTLRGIRPTNIFFRGQTRLLSFGDMVSSPPGMAQPLAYESIEGGMALPYCRGAGASGDDLYALGVTLIFLFLGMDPTAAIDPKELLRAKIDRSSFTAIVGNARLPPESSELIRGLLNDDARERWSIEDVEHWLQGRRLKPRQQSPSSITATRPFDFGGRACYTARAVADAFASDPTAAARAIRSPEFEIWLQRSLAEEKRSVAVASVRTDVADSRSNLTQDLRLTARTCIALDPPAPIRYADFSAAFDTLGSALVSAFNGHGSLQTIGEVLTARLPQLWLSSQNSLRPDLLALSQAKPLEALRRFAEDPRPGFGLERVLYELNPGLPCLSPLIQEDHVSKISQILAALEAAAARGGIGGDGIIDRHVAAYVAAHSRHLGRECFDFLSGTPRQRVLGTLGILAHLQATHGPATVPALGKLMSGQTAMLVDMFHSRQRRSRMRSEITKLAEKGALGDLFWLLNASSEPGRDAQDFALAQREYAAIEKALALLRRSEPMRPARAIDAGGRAGVVTATFVAALIGIIALLRVW